MARTASTYGAKRPSQDGIQADALCSESFLESIKSLYGDEKYSDFSIKCDDRTYHLHKAIVGPRAPVFDAMLNSSLQEGQTSTIDLSEDDAFAVHCMVQYFYFHNYDAAIQSNSLIMRNRAASGRAPKRKSARSRTSTRTLSANRLPPAHHPIRLHAEIYVLADRYNIDGLKALALGKFDTAWQESWDAKAMMSAVRLAYEWTKESDKGLRGSVIVAMSEHQDLVFQNKNMKDELQAMGSLMYDLAACIASHGSGRGYGASTGYYGNNHGSHNRAGHLCLHH